MLNVDKNAANIALAQNFYAMFFRGDLAAIVDNCTPDVVWESVGDRAQFPIFGHWDGKEGVKAFFAKLVETHDFTEFSPKEFYSSGDHVFVCGHYGMTIKKTGRHVEMDWVHVFVLRDGLCGSFREHTDTATLARGWRD